jgi:hypothetical protein
MFKSAKVTTISGHNWTTRINGSFDEIVSYFLGQRFDIGIFPVEKMERVVKVEVFGIDGSFEGQSIDIRNLLESSGLAVGSELTDLGVKIGLESLLKRVLYFQGTSMSEEDMILDLMSMAES